METVASFRSSFSNISWNRSAPNPPVVLTRVGLKSMVSIRPRPSISHLQLGNGKLSFVSRKCISIKASMKQPCDSDVSSCPLAPLRLESPIGQFLSEILISHPHLVHAAVEQQLEQLQTDRDAEKQKEDPSASGTELVLYRRIAEVKASERTKALEEILYTLVVQKFMDANIPLIPSITSTSSSDNSGQTIENLERLHSPEAFEMIQNHLSLILGKRMGESKSVAQTSKLRVGQVYAASVMYGYFLRRVDQRFQLEKTIKTLPQGYVEKEEISIQQISDGSRQESIKNIGTHKELEEDSFGIMTSRLRNYVMSFEGETLKRYATIRSQEAVSIIESHTEALFGRPEIVITPQGTIDSSKDEVIKISFGGLRRLVLEAVTFGSFLWDVESYVDSRYHFVAN